MNSAQRENFMERLELVFNGDANWPCLSQLFGALLESENWWETAGLTESFDVLGGNYEYQDNETLAEDGYQLFVHQNTRGEDAILIVPFLSELLPQVSPPNQVALILLLLDIALGTPQWHMKHGLVLAHCRGAYMTKN